MTAICHILHPFPVFQPSGIEIARTEAGQVWSGHIDSNGDFIFWIPDKSGTLWKARIKAGNENVKLLNKQTVQQ